MSEIEIGIEIIPGKEEKDEDTILKLTEHSDCSKEKSRLNPFFVIQVSQGLNVCEITFNSFQARMATETFETLRNLDWDAFMLDQWCVEDGCKNENS